MSAQQLNDRVWDVNTRVAAVVDLQFGDTGKGKIVDILADRADIIARGTGGANAGHTIVNGGKTFVCHLLPSGVARDGEGKVSIIGRGVAVDPGALCDELSSVERMGGTWNGLRVSHNALLVLPIDIALDRLKDVADGNGAIGTTGRGMGPVYQTKAARTGLRVNDLLNRGVFIEKLRRNLDARAALLKGFDEEVCRKVFASEELGAFWDARAKMFDAGAIADRYFRLAAKFRDAIADTDDLIHAGMSEGKRVLLEGAQGLLLSVEYGAAPYQTSSDCSLAGLALGVGLWTDDVQQVINVAKAPYMTRVGAGPFPTELGGAESAGWCATRRRKDEGIDNINSLDPFLQGAAIRQVGNEYGATTGRPRRVGWLDLPLLRYASYWGKHRGASQVILTKVDVLNECQKIRLCTGHIYEGEEYQVGQAVLKKGTLLDRAIMDTHVLERCTPLYSDYPGWGCPLGKEMAWKDLPVNLQGIVGAIERQAGVEVIGLSMGPDREDMIVI